MSVAAALSLRREWWSQCFVITQRSEPVPVARGERPGEIPQMMFVVNRMKGTRSRTLGRTVRAGRPKQS